MLAAVSPPWAEHMLVHDRGAGANEGGVQVVDTNDVRQGQNTGLGRTDT